MALKPLACFFVQKFFIYLQGQSSCNDNRNLVIQMNTHNVYIKHMQL